MSIQRNPARPLPQFYFFKEKYLKVIAKESHPGQSNGRRPRAEPSKGQALTFTLSGVIGGFTACDLAWDHIEEPGIG